MGAGTSPTWKFAKKIVFSTFVLVHGQPDLPNMYSALRTPIHVECVARLGKCILRPRQTIFTHQRPHGQLIPKCVYFGHQERSPTHATLLRRQTPSQQQNKIGTLPGLIFKQSYFGREVAILGNAIFRPPGCGVGLLECGHHCNSIIAVFRQ